MEELTPRQLNISMSNAGRPTKMDEITLKKLEEAFLLGCSDEEACFYANISPATLYNYQKEHPEFLERKKALKLNPILKARKTVVERLEESYQNAMDYLKRKKKDEFSERQELTGKEGQPLVVLPSEIIDKNGVTPNTKTSSEGQT